MAPGGSALLRCTPQCIIQVSKPEHCETKKRLAALLPRNVVRKKVKKWSDLTPEQKNLVEMPPGRSAGSDPENDVGLGPTL